MFVIKGEISHEKKLVFVFEGSCLDPDHFAGEEGDG